MKESGKYLGKLIQRVNLELPTIYEWLCFNKLPLSWSKIFPPRHKLNFNLYRPLKLANQYLEQKFLVSKETVVLRQWEIETEIYFIKRVDKGQIATVKDLESLRSSVSPSSERIEELWLL